MSEKFKFGEKVTKDLKPKEKRKLFKIWSQKIREKAGRKCEICSATERLNSHHILDRNYYHEYRFDEKNGICLCPRCHKWGKYSAHKNPVWFTQWLKKNKSFQYRWIISHMGVKV